MSAVASAPRSSGLGTYVELAVTDDAALAQAGAILRNELEELDLACSRFRPDSELSRANAAAGSAFPATQRLRDAVKVALTVAEDTAGLVDPTLGDALIAAGYDRDFAELRDDAGQREEPSALLAAAHAFWPGWADVRVDDIAGTVFVPAGCSLDLGATAKARGADLAAALIADRLGVGVLVSLGGDVAMSGPAPSGGWPVRVSTTTVSDGTKGDGETVMLGGGGLATSSPGARQWVRAGQPQHHIIDPETRRPVASPWASVTVAASNCVSANAATTAAVVLGPAAPRWLAGTGYPCRLVADDGAIFRIGGWPEPGVWSR